MAQQFYPNRDWLRDVAAGSITGFSGIVVSGVTFSMGTNWMSVWDANDEIIDLSLQSSAATVKVSSTDADDNSSGNGARTVLVIGLDSSGDVQTETVSLNGQTEVATTNTWSAIHTAKVLTVGSTGSNEGVIWIGNGTVTSGVPATKFLLVDLGLNISHTYIFTVPSGKQARVVNVSLSSSDLDKGYTFRLCIVTPGQPSIYTNVRGMAGGNNLTIAPFFTPAIPAGTTITLQAKAEQGSDGNFAVVTELLLEDI